MRADDAFQAMSQSDINAAHSFFQGASRLIRLSCSESNLYISSWGDTSKMLFASENDLSAVWDMANRDALFAITLQIKCYVNRFRAIEATDRVRVGLSVSRSGQHRC